MYISKYYTCEEIDQRLLQGYYDDLVKAGFVGTINEFWAFLLSIKNKVDKREGYDLSKNDFTDELKAKLDGIEDKANYITKVSQLENDMAYMSEEQVQQMISDLVDGADDALDTLKELAEALGNDPNFATNITNKLTDLRISLTEEISRAKEEELKLGTRISEVNTQMEAHIQELSNHIDSVVTNINTKILQLEGKVESNTKAIADLTNSTTEKVNEAREYAKELVDAEQARATAAEGKNAEAIASLTNTHVTDKAELQSAINAEASERKEQDSQIKESIETLKSDTNDKVTKVNAAIEKEVTDRKAADETLKSSIAEEVTNRASEITRVEGLINQEATERKAKDEILEHSIQDLDSKLDTTNSDLAQKLEQEIKDRKDADDLKVDKKEGYGLSKNDFTDILLQKLNGIEDKANYITKVSQLINDSGYQTREQVEEAIEKIIGAAPEVLDTLEEIAKALGDDPNFAATITKKLAAITEQLNEEVEQRIVNDNTLQSNIDAEVQERKVALTQLADSLNASISKEAQDRKDADAALQVLITTEKADRIKADDLLRESINTLASVVADNYQELKLYIETLRSDLMEEVHTNDALISKNTENIQRNLELIQGLQSSFDSQTQALSDKINKEISDRTNADNALSKRISTVATDLATETANRVAGDTILDNKIANEVSNRTESIRVLDEKLTHAIQDEAEARATKDSELDKKIEDLKGTSEADIKDLTSKLNQEISDRKVADTALGTRVDNNTNAIATEVIRATNREDALANQIAAIDGKYDSSIEALRSDLAKEVQERKSEDEDIRLSLDWMEE